MRSPPRWREFVSPQALADELGASVAGLLRRAIAAKGKAVIAVSGGTTPTRFFRVLSRQPLDWKSVIVTLVDERFVEPTTERSNERLVRGTLLQAEARDAGFVPLFTPSAGVDAAAREASLRQQAIGPLDVAILGMGLDGHTASYFPDAEGIVALLDSGIEHDAVLAIEAPSAGELRLTQSLHRLAAARHVFLHIEGEEKKAVLHTALTAAEARAPVRRLLDAAPHGEIYWSPA